MLAAKHLLNVWNCNEFLIKILHASFAYFNKMNFCTHHISYVFNYIQTEMEFIQTHLQRDQRQNDLYSSKEVLFANHAQREDYLSHVILITK